jgi:hypothetical protein
MYVRIGVHNLNPDVAVDCRAYLTNVESLESRDGADQFVPTIYNDSMPLVWSFEPSTQSVVLPKGVKRHFDLLILNEGTPGFDVQLRHPAGEGRIIAEPYQPIFTQSPALRFTVLVGGHASEPALLRLAIRWTGAWPPHFSVE